MACCRRTKAAATCCAGSSAARCVTAGCSACASDFFWKMVAPLVEEMGAAYPELAAKRATVEQALRAEEQRFGETLEQGMKVFEEVAKKSPASGFRARMRSVSTTPTAFRSISRPTSRASAGSTVDMAGFEAAMNAQRERARAASQFESKGELAGRAREHAAADEVPRLRHARRRKLQAARDRARRTRGRVARRRRGSDR